MMMYSWCLLWAIYSALLICLDGRSFNMWNSVGEDSFFKKPIPEHCGRSRGDFHLKHRTLPFTYNSKVKRIVGGLDSEEGEWPWLVSMMLKREGSDRFEHLCGGTLISPQWVVTAAHCFEDMWADFLTDDPKAWMVRVGEHDMFDDKTSHIDITPERFFFPPARDAQATISMDIALAKLSEPVKMARHINVACLPNEEEYVPDGSFCVTAGWGHTVEGGNVSEIVRHVQVPVLKNTLCNVLYDDIEGMFKLEIPDDMMCAGFDDGGKDACQYDSGGPMVCFNLDTDQWLLSGIISIGYGCARPGYPGIYTRVSSYVDWIEEIVALHG